MNRRIKFGEPGDKTFMIGTMINPPDSDSQGRDGRWCVNCVNMWAATLGMKLNPRNAIIKHLVITLHEMTHAFSGVRWCNPDTWDPFIERILNEFQS